jgi:hypothetical protein
MGDSMRGKKRDRKSRNEKAHNAPSSPERVKVFLGHSVEGMPIYVWVKPPADCEHDLT